VKGPHLGSLVRASLQASEKGLNSNNHLHDWTDFEGGRQCNH
jgi:hypothetical protein